jgi:hypothetical protein
MSYQPIIPIWGGLNNANSTSSTGLSDPVTGQQYNTGGLEVGDYFDLTEKQANDLSVSATGTCHAGRYRYVQVDSGATLSNVKTGTIGYLRAGGGIGRVKSVVITNAGTGATAGTYNISANVGSGGGAGATIQVVVGSGGTITSAIVTNGGAGYNSVPTFSLTATSTSAGAVAAQLDTSANVVTSYDQAVTVTPLTGVPVRPVVFLNASGGTTAGNYTFIQELGVATVLGQSGAFTDNPPHVGDWIDSTTLGVVNARAATASPIGQTIGQAIDLPVQSNLFKVLLTGPVVQD